MNLNIQREIDQRRNIQREIDQLRIDQLRIDRQLRTVNRYRDERPHPLTVIGAIAVIGSAAFLVCAIIRYFL